ncbi:MAG: D-alanyl-D-alanine carboxypeptidase family protein [Peptostreptococcaceae bacterium]|nr:D-alanyl-D-alanine carboxypeptidase family protein [Peptostreptococcaceae bacterium]
MQNTVKRNILFLLLMLIMRLLIPHCASAHASFPEIGAESALLIEAKSGKVLYEKNPDAKVFPASTTKVMTAILAIERLDLNKEIIVPTNIGQADGSAMYLLPGERFTVKELLQGLMIKSANDAAVLLAREISGDVNKFSELMNEEAKKLGCKNTNFVNPNGLHDENHYTTARDMALISQEAMKSEVFRELVSTVRVTFDETEQTPEKRYFLNTNRFLWDESKLIINDEYIPIKYDVINGVKTGYTPEAKNCLVSSGVKNGIELISLVYLANGFEMYRDSRLILDYGFEHYVSKTVIEKNKVLGKLEMKHTVPGFLEYYAQDEHTVVYNKTEKPQAQTEVLMDEFKLPVLKDSKIGELKLSFAGETIQVPLYASNDLESIFTVKYFRQWVIENKIIVSGIALCVILLIITLFVIFRLSSDKRRRRKKHIKRYNNLY